MPGRPASLTLMKHHALGNDFLVTFDEVVDPVEFARYVCDRRRGIGADGLLLATTRPQERWRMVLHNADGGRAEMSGNGIRCFAHAVARLVGIAEGVVRVETDAGLRDVELRAGETIDTMLANVEMGEVVEGTPSVHWPELGVDPSRPVAHLSLGNPHSVVLCDEIDKVDLVRLGQIVSDTNLEIVESTGERSRLRMRVHERGAGLTEACGTGATATAFAARTWGLVDDAVQVDMPGGHVTVLFDGRRATLVGPTTYVATVQMRYP